jgi:hypothetical protein
MLVWDRVTVAVRPARLVTTLAALLLAVACCAALPSPAAAAAGDDWRRAKLIVTRLAADSPSRPVVLLLGGSAARESTVSDGRWQDQIERRGGPLVVARNLGSSNQTFDQSRFLVERLGGTRAVILIGITYGRFTADPAASFSKALEPVVAYTQHRYSVRRILTRDQKRALVRRWRDTRLPVFKRHYAGNLADLEALVETCPRAATPRCCSTCRATCR